MQSGYLSFDGSRIHYLLSGTGKKILVCFHGYGESASNFSFLGPHLNNSFTILAIDLPFHGETQWSAASFDGKKLKEIVSDIISNENLAFDNLYLMGFSLGGRIALSLFQELPQHVKRLVLLAPDGLKLNFWYWFSTQTLIGSKCFKFTMRHPGWFLGMLKIGNKLGLINRSIFKFVEYYIHDEQLRKELYDRWITMRHCKPDLSKIKKDIQQNQATLRLLYGIHDRIILLSPANRFMENIDNAKIELLECGHQVLHPKNAADIVASLIR
jgi:pimeloyl-ACP methyl ester carboxylesterase